MRRPLQVSVLHTYKATHSRRNFFVFTTDEFTSQLNPQKIVALSDRLGKPLVLKGKSFLFTPLPPPNTRTFVSSN